MYTQNQIDIIELELDLEFYEKCLPDCESTWPNHREYLVCKIASTRYLLNECYAKEKSS